MLDGIGADYSSFGFIRFDTLEKICEVLQCQPGDILVFEADVSDGRGS